MSQPVDSRALAYGDGGRGEKWGDGETWILPVRSNVQGGLAQPRSQAAVGRTLKEGRSHTGVRKQPPGFLGVGEGYQDGSLEPNGNSVWPRSSCELVASVRLEVHFGLDSCLSSRPICLLGVTYQILLPALLFPAKVCWRHGADGITALERALVWGLLCLFR